MKLIFRIHIEYDLKEDEIKNLKELSEAEIENRRNEIIAELRRDFYEFPDEAIKELDVYIDEG